jgi:GDP/UDP-N,N'-diacetylbacillosamine 2-epimerase (hydrolysing)
METKKIIGVTGSRSEYDIMFSVFKELDRSEIFDLSIIVSGSHLVEFFGYTIEEIKNDGFKIAGKVHNLLNSDQALGKAKGAGLLLTGLAEQLAGLDPDYVIASGDREETIIAATACTYLEIPFIHLAGGDRSYPGEQLGDVDEQIRHATTKLASIHFPFCKEHEERLIKMGEEPWRICCSGNPALDRFNLIPSMSRTDILKYFGFHNPDRPFVLVIQHVISSESKSGSEQIRITLETLAALDINVIINYPNSDTGSQAIIKTIESFSACPNFKITKNIQRDYFVNLLRNVDLLVGNSSMALLEGSYLALPAINVGNRQRERLHGGNVVFVDFDEKQIKETVEKILYDKKYRSNLKNCQKIYGVGNAAQNILSFLASLKKTRSELVSKNITY